VLLGYDKFPAKDLVKWWFWPIVGYYQQEDYRSVRSLLYRSEKMNREKQQERFLDEFDSIVENNAIPDSFTNRLDRGVPFPLEGRWLSVRSYLFGLALFARDMKATAYRASILEVPGENQAMTADTSGTPIRFEFTDAREGWLFPLFYYLSDPRPSTPDRPIQSKFKLLLGLLYSGSSQRMYDGGAIEKESVLGFLYRRKRENERVNVDVFPFISWDQTPEMHKFSFAGGLIEFGSREGDANYKFLWIPLNK
jgi:hypothetical protein